MLGVQFTESGKRLGEADGCLDYGVHGSMAGPSLEDARRPQDGSTISPTAFDQICGSSIIMLVPVEDDAWPHGGDLHHGRDLPYRDFEPQYLSDPGGDLSGGIEPRANHVNTGTVVYQFSGQSESTQHLPSLRTLFPPGFESSLSSTVPFGVSTEVRVAIHEEPLRIAQVQQSLHTVDPPATAYRPASGKRLLSGIEEPIVPSLSSGPSDLTAAVSSRGMRKSRHRAAAQSGRAHCASSTNQRNDEPPESVPSREYKSTAGLHLAPGRPTRPYTARSELPLLYVSDCWMTVRWMRTTLRGEEVNAYCYADEPAASVPRESFSTRLIRNVLVYGRANHGNRRMPAGDVWVKSSSPKQVSISLGEGNWVEWQGNVRAEVVAHPLLPSRRLWFDFEKEFVWIKTKSAAGVTSLPNAANEGDVGCGPRHGALHPLAKVVNERALTKLDKGLALAKDEARRLEVKADDEDDAASWSSWVDASLSPSQNASQPDPGDTSEEAATLSLFSPPNGDRLTFGSGVYYDSERIRDVNEDEAIQNAGYLYNHRLAAWACSISSYADVKTGIFSVYQLARSLNYMPASLPGQVFNYAPVDDCAVRWLPSLPNAFPAMTIEGLNRPVLIRLVGRLITFQVSDGHGLPLGTVSSTLLPAYFESRVAAQSILRNLSHLPLGTTFSEDYNIPVYADRSQISRDTVSAENISVSPFICIRVDPDPCILRYYHFET
ncbi:hypothetical protein BV25DRAFT_1920364 [Artomyces pyxidatus]|uniref:Uncharacterized protein n=1 Tax=Artomyces pyxidatus TaxID=48021 RepID=A0ACB8SLR8_9AGAM|nr:hypothetical protein BV25DRAFT_1920364 [Artomyces pyxidatus]